MSDTLTLLDQAISHSQMELGRLAEGNVEEAETLCQTRGRLIDQALGIKERVSLDDLMAKLEQLKSLQGRLTSEAKKLHASLKEDLTQAKRENKRISGYAKASRSAPRVKAHYISKNS